MNVTNCYDHCGEAWDEDDCDSFHNDRCPVCNREIEPFMSIVYTEEGEQYHYHK